MSIGGITTLAYMKSIHDLNAIYVVPDMRGRGIGHALFETMVNILGDDENAMIISLDLADDKDRFGVTLTEKVRIVDWCKRAGFVAVATIRNGTHQVKNQCTMCTDDVSWFALVKTALSKLASAVKSWVVNRWQ
jgi:GNAT superfamily N-acetyltransferase